MCIRDRSLIGIAIALLFFGVYVYLQYKYKARIFKVVGTGSDQAHYTIGRHRYDMARVLRDGSWQFLFSRKNIEPFDNRYIYSGNKIYVYDINGKFMPGQINCGKEGFSINPVPYHIKKKIELELQQLEQDFAKMDKWEANKLFVYMLIGGGIVIAFAGFVIWLAFMKTDELVPALSDFTSSLSNVNTIPGK